MELERDLVSLGMLPPFMRWLLEQSTDLEPVGEYETCSVEACAALARFLKPWARIDRARRIEPVELHARVKAAHEEMATWNRRVRSGVARGGQPPKRRNKKVANILESSANQIVDYLKCRQTLTPRQWVEHARAEVERLYVLRPRDEEFRHGISFAVSGLEQALGQLPE